MYKKHCGFTLAELLISLAILGVIAMFTIPKVLNSSQSQQYNSAAKEVISMISGAYDVYRLNNTPTATTGLLDLTPYMNYVRIDTSSTVDGYENSTSTVDCRSITICLVLHQGGRLYIYNNRVFDGVSTTNVLFTLYDPDNEASGVIGAPGKSLGIVLYRNGRITSRAGVTANSAADNYTDPFPVDVNSDPSWFSW